MKITPKELKQIIKEEYERTLNELEHDERDEFGQFPDERGDPDTWDRPDPYRVDALAAVDQLKELISDVDPMDTGILEHEDVLAAVEALRNKLEYYMS